MPMLQHRRRKPGRAGPISVRNRLQSHFHSIARTRRFLQFLVLPSAFMLAIAAVTASPANAADDPIPVKQQFGMVLKGAPMQARSIGSYARGCLAGGQAMPVDGPAWQAMRLSRNRNWGHPELIAWLEQFARDVKAKDDWPGLMIGDISQPRGGPMLSGHRSHQIGLDADIWYLPMPSRTLTWEEREKTSSIALADYRSTQINAANWNPGYVRILKRAASHSRIARVFVHPAVKKALCEAVPADDDRAWLGKIRPIYGHNYHFHVRMDCPSGLRGCIPQKDPPPGDGCGDALDWWLKEVSKPEKPAKPKAEKPDAKPAKPSVRTLAWLPSACRDVLAVDKLPLLSNVAPVSTDIPAPERRPGHN